VRGRRASQRISVEHFFLTVCTYPLVSPLFIGFGQMDMGEIGKGEERGSVRWVWVWVWTSLDFSKPSPTAGNARIGCKCSVRLLLPSVVQSDGYVTRNRGCARVRPVRAGSAPILKETWEKRRQSLLSRRAKDQPTKEKRYPLSRPRFDTGAEMARWGCIAVGSSPGSNATFWIDSVQELPDRFVPFRHCPWLIQTQRHRCRAIIYCCHSVLSPYQNK